MKKNYTCNNFGDCDYADEFETFELDEHELKCPKCGRDNTLEEETSNGDRGNSLLNKLKNPLVAGIIGGIGLLGGGGYYYSTIPDTPKEKVIEDNKSVPQVQSKEEPIEEKKPIKDSELEDKNRDIQIAWGIVKDTKDIKLLEDFNTKYPKSPYFSTVEIKIDDLKRQKEKEDERIAKEKEDKRIAKEKARQAEIKLWKRAKSENKIKVYELFINKYPNSEYVSIARSKIEDLIEANRKFSLTVHTTPTNANVRVLTIKPKYHNGIQVKRGKHKIEVSANGYYSKTFFITIEKDKTVNITLTPKPIYEPELPVVISNPPKIEVRIVKQTEPKVSKCRQEINAIKNTSDEIKALQEVNSLFLSGMSHCSESEKNALKSLKNSL